MTIEEATKENKHKGNGQFFVRMNSQDVDELESFTKKQFDSVVTIEYSDEQGISQSYY